MDLVFLHGPAAAGKLTTARALEDLVGLPVFHNHLVVDALTAVLPFGSASFVHLREAFWLAVMREAAREDRSLSFTFAPEPTVGHGFAERVRATVEEQGGRVRFVRLEVSEQVQEQRIENPDRAEFHKLNSRATLRRLRATETAAAVEQPPADLVIDTGISSPKASARAIAHAFDLRPRPRTVRYPDPVTGPVPPPS
ncbi:hypothetical protein [Brachybacterium hainanense]|uniref:Shikimate kinase n=1 Tax=Brachybacterium hainanense TaxID=1541174 RepID=A0ABV6R910_9MICO